MSPSARPCDAPTAAELLHGRTLLARPDGDAREAADLLAVLDDALHRLDRLVLLLADSPRGTGACASLTAC